MTPKEVSFWAYAQNRSVKMYEKSTLKTGA